MNKNVSTSSCTWRSTMLKSKKKIQLNVCSLSLYPHDLPTPVNFELSNSWRHGPAVLCTSCVKCFGSRSESLLTCTTPWQRHGQAGDGPVRTPGMPSRTCGGAATAPKNSARSLGQRRDRPLEDPLYMRRPARPALPWFRTVVM